MKHLYGVISIFLVIVFMGLLLRYVNRPLQKSSIPVGEENVVFEAVPETCIWSCTYSTKERIALIYTGVFNGPIRGQVGPNRGYHRHVMFTKISEMKDKYKDFQNTTYPTCYTVPYIFKKGLKIPMQGNAYCKSVVITLQDLVGDKLYYNVEETKE